MIAGLNKKQIMWVLGGSRRPFNQATIDMFVAHYVNGVPKTEAAVMYDLSPQFASKRWSRFEELLREKCEKYDLKISTILHDKSDAKAVLEFDVVNRKEGK